MSEVQQIIDRCRKRNGGQVSLRELWPGRGANPTKIRANAKRLFGDSQIVPDFDEKGIAKGTESKFVYDKQKGIYQLAS